MDIQKLKKWLKKNQTPVAFVFIIVVVLFLAIGQTLKNKQKRTDKEKQLVTAETSSLYDSKLAAYKAKQKEQQKGKVVDIKSDYSLFGSNSDDEINNEQSKVIEPEEIIEEESEYDRRKAQAVQPKPKKSASAYSQKAQQLKAIAQDEDVPKYTDSRIEAKEIDKPELDEKAKRLEAMKRGWGINSSQTVNVAQSFKGVVHGTQEVGSGEVITLRNTEEIKIGGKTVPRNTILSGAVSLSKNRLMITVPSVRLENELVPVNLIVYASDGMQGIPTGFDATADAVDGQLEKEAISQIQRYGGKVGRVVGSVANSVSRSKKQTVKLLDCQTIYFKVK